MTSPSLIEFNCPHCFRSMQLPAHLEGKQGRCSACNKLVMVVDSVSELQPGRNDSELLLPEIVVDPPPASRRQFTRENTGLVKVLSEFWSADSETRIRMLLKRWKILLAIGFVFALIVGPASDPPQPEITLSSGSTGHDWVKATKSERLKLINECFTIHHSAIIGGSATHVPIRSELLIALVDWYFKETTHREEKATDVIRSAADHRNIQSTKARKMFDAMRRFGDVLDDPKYPESIIPR